MKKAEKFLKRVMAVLLATALSFTSVSAYASAVEAGGLQEDMAEGTLQQAETEIETENENAGNGPEESSAGESAEKESSPESGSTGESVAESSTLEESGTGEEGSKESGALEEGVSAGEGAQESEGEGEEPGTDSLSTAYTSDSGRVATEDLREGMDIDASEVKYSEKKALLIQDSLPWVRENGSNKIDSNQEVLKELVSYDITTTKKFPNLDLSDYSLILFANDQTVATYSNYARIKDKMEEFAENGGIIYFGAADGGWADGYLAAELPGGVTKTSRYTYDNEIVMENHPIVTGLLTDGESLTNSLLHSTYCSHAYFNEDSFPEGTVVILREKDGYPTLIEYPLGNGRVIASGLTWEHNYIYGGSSSSFKPFAERAMDDLYSYALYISSLGNDNIEKLLNEKIDADSHMIIVADENTKDLLPNVKVSLGGVEMTTDGNGRVIYKNVEKGKSAVSVSADGYRTKKAYYQVLGGDVHYFFLSKNTYSSQYITGAVVDVTSKDEDGNSETVSYDLMESNVTIEKDKEYKVTISGEWNGQEPGHYLLYLDDQYAYSLDGVFTIKDGKCSNSKGEEITFGDGRVNARMLNAAGDRSEVMEIRLYSKKSSSGSLFGQDNHKLFSLGKSFGFTVPDKYPVIGNMDFSLSIGSIPISYEVSEDEIKFAIGITDFSDLKSPGKTWEDFKKKFEVVKRTKNLSEIKKTFGAKSGAMTLKKGWDDPDFDVVGYAVGKFDPDTGEVTGLTGEAVVSVEMMYKYNQQFVVGPVPVYFEIGGGFSVSDDLSVEGILVKDGQLIVDNSLTLTPKFTIGGGVGINGALSAGAEGEASLPIVICDSKFNVDAGTEDYFSNVSLAGEMKVKASLLFVFKAEKSIAKGEWQILRYYWDTGEIEWFEAEDLEAQAASTDLLDTGSYTVLERTDSGDWYTSLTDTAALQEGMTVLQQGIMPTSDPQVTRLEDGTAIMVFQQDNGSRASLDRSCLMYSVFSNGVWGDPKAVWDNGLADMSASITSSGDSTYVVWQKANKSFGDDADPDAVAAACEIAVAKYNPEKRAFEEARYITDDNILQMQPKGVTDGNDTYAVYVSNSKSELLGGGINTIYAQSLDTGLTQKIYSGSQYVTALDGTVASGQLSVAYILDQDSDLNTVDDTEVYVYSGGNTDRLTKDEYAQVNAQYCDGTLYWFQAETGEIYSYADNQTSVFADSDTMVGTNFEVIQNGSKTAIMWIGVNEEGQKCIYAVVKYASGWSKPIELVATENNIMQMAGYLDDEGDWEFIAVSEDESTASLLYSGVKPYISTKAENITIVARNREELYNRLTADFTNEGEDLIESLHVEFRDADDEVIYEREIPCSVRGGETVKLNSEIYIPQQDGPIDYEVYIYPEGEDDLSDNHGPVSMGYADIVLTVEKLGSGLANVLNVSIYNDSDMESNALLTIHEDDPEDGIIVDRINIGSLEPGSTQVISYTYNLMEMDFEGSGTKTYYYSVTSSIPEENLENNTAVTVFSNPFFTEDGLMPEPTGISINVPDPVVLSVDKAPSYKLGAMAFPVVSSGWPLIYQSSDNNVVTVDENGVLEAVKAGTAQVTVTAADTDITETVNVRVEGESSRKFRIELNEISVETSSYQAEDVYRIKVLGNDSDTVFRSDLFTFDLSDTSVASIEDGCITLLRAGETTLSAHYKGDNSLYAELEICVEPKKVGYIAANYTLNGTEGTDSNISLTPGELKNSTLVFAPVAYAENGTVLENVEFAYQSSNTKVLKINSGGMVSCGSKEGVSVVKISVPGSDVYALTSVYSYNSYKPVLLTSSVLTVNQYKSAGTEFEMQTYGYSAPSYSSALYKKSGSRYTSVSGLSVSQVSEDADGRVIYAVAATSTTKKLPSGTLYFRTYANGKYYYTGLKIKITKSMPSVKVSMSKFNAFYADAYSDLTVTSDASVKSVSMTYVSNGKLRNGCFSLDTTNGYRVRGNSSLKSAMQSGYAFSKINRKYKVTIYLDGYSKPVQKTLTIPASYTAPKLTLSNSVFKVNSGLPAAAVTYATVKNGKTVVDMDWLNATVTTSGLSISSPAVDAIGKVQLVLPSSLSKKTTGKLSVYSEEWLGPITAKITMEPASKLKYKIASAVSVNPALNRGGSVDFLVSGGQRVILSEAALVDDGLFKITSDDSGIHVEPLADKTSYKKSSYSYKIPLSSSDGVDLGKYTLTVKVSKAVPKVSVANKSLYLDMSQRNHVITNQLKSDFTANPLDPKKTRVVITKNGEESNDISVACAENGVLTIKTQQKQPGEFQVEVTPITVYGAELAKVGFVVNGVANTQITTKTSGKLDAMKRASSTATVTLGVRNSSAKIQSVAIKSQFKSDFEIRSVNLTAKKPTVKIGVKAGLIVEGGKKSVPFVVKMSDGTSVEATAQVTVSASKCKITCPSLYLYDTMKTYRAYGTMTPSPSAENEVISIVQLDNKELFTVIDNGSGEFEVAARNKGFIKKKTYVIKCAVHSMNDLKNSAGTTVKLKIVVK